MHHWADLQSVQGFRCHDNIARTRNVSECLYSLYAWFVVGSEFIVVRKLLTFYCSIQKVKRYAVLSLCS